MKKIYIGFSSPIGSFEPFAALIKWVEDRPYDHVYVRMQEPMNGEYLIFQASKLQVNFFNKDIFQSLNTPLKEYELDITDDQYAALWKFAIDNLGIPYSIKEDFGILLMKIFKLASNPYDAGMSVEFCAQLCANVCKLVGIPIPEQSSSVDPTLMDSILESLGKPMVAMPTF